MLGKFHCITVGGDDGLSFLQGLITCQIDPEHTTWQYGAFCTQKGRVLTTCLVTCTHQPLTMQLLVPESMASALWQHLNRYIVIQSVTLDQTEKAMTLSDLGIESFKHTEAQTSSLKADPDLDLIHDNQLAWQHGWVWITPETTQSYTPQMLGLDRLNAVSFSKGCYLGQEVIARTQHLGQPKRWLYRVRSDAPVTLGTKIAHPAGGSIDVLACYCLEHPMGYGLLCCLPRLDDQPTIIRDARATLSNIRGLNE